MTSERTSLPNAPVASRLAACFNRALQLSVDQKDFEYAHVIFTECVLGDPSNTKYVDAMLRNLNAMFPKPRRRAFLYKPHTTRAINKSTAERDWASVLRLGIQQLRSDPWNSAILRSMADACAALHYNEVELAYLKQALDEEPNDIGVNRHCARSLARMGQFDQAIACWHRVEKLSNGDEEAARMISHLYEEKLRYPGGRPPESATSRPQAAHQAASQDEHGTQSPFEVTLSNRQRLERAIEANPAELENYLALADLFSETGLLEQAESILHRAEKACGEHQSIAERLQQVAELRSRQQAAAAEARRLAEMKQQPIQIRIPWLELGLLLTVFILALQLSPRAADATWRIVDLRNWSRSGWIIANVVILLGLIAIRFAPSWLHRRRRRA